MWEVCGRDAQLADSNAGFKPPPQPFRPSPRGREGVGRGSGGGRQGIYRSSADARKPQNPINSDEYQGHLQ
eukprot:441863-Prorocentrum_minimum.AAC.1